MEPKFSLNQVVKMHTGTTDVTATVIGIWFSAFAEPQFLVRYFDTTNRICEAWMNGGALVAL